MEKDRRRKKKDLLVSCVHDDDMKERAKVVCDFRLHPSTPSFLQSIKISSAFVMTRYFFFSSSFLIFFVVLCMLCTALYTHSKDFHPFFSSNAKSKRIFLFFLYIIRRAHKQVYLEDSFSASSRNCSKRLNSGLPIKKKGARRGANERAGRKQK